MTQLDPLTKKPLNFDPELFKFDESVFSVDRSKKIVPLITSGNFEAQCLKKKEALPIILDNDEFMENLSNFDCQLRMKQNKDGDWKKAYPNYYAQQILEWTESEKAELNAVVSRVRPQLANLNVTLPQTINFVKTTGREELDGTAAYCRKNTIVVCGGTISEHLLIHELFHIHSQVDPKNRGKLYELIGFNACNPIQLPKSLADRRVVNPDSPSLNAYVELNYQGKKVKAVPFDIHDAKRKPEDASGGSTFLRGVFHQFIVVEEKDGKMTYADGPIVFDFKDCDFEVGKNTDYTDSPEEIIADNFRIMVKGWKPVNDDLIKNIRKVFLENKPDLTFAPLKKQEEQIPNEIPVQPLEQMKIDKVQQNLELELEKEKPQNRPQAIVVDEPQGLGIQDIEHKRNEESLKIEIPSQAIHEAPVQIKNIEKPVIKPLEMPPVVQEEPLTIDLLDEPFLPEVPEVEPKIVDVIPPKVNKEKEKPQVEQKNKPFYQKLFEFLSTPFRWFINLFKDLFN